MTSFDYDSWLADNDLSPVVADTVTKAWPRRKPRMQPEGGRPKKVLHAPGFTGGVGGVGGAWGSARDEYGYHLSGNVKLDRAVHAWNKKVVAGYEPKDVGAEFTAHLRRHGFE